MPREKIRDGSVLVEFKDAGGKVLRRDITNDHDLYHLAKVAVKGRLIKDDAGNYSVSATGFYVSEKSKLDYAETEKIKKAR